MLKKRTAEMHSREISLSADEDERSRCGCWPCGRRAIVQERRRIPHMGESFPETPRQGLRNSSVARLDLAMDEFFKSTPRAVEQVREAVATPRLVPSLLSSRTATAAAPKRAPSISPSMLRELQQEQLRHALRASVGSSSSPSVQGSSSRDGALPESPSVTGGPTRAECATGGGSTSTLSAVGMLLHERPRPAGRRRPSKDGDDVRAPPRQGARTERASEVANTMINHPQQAHGGSYFVI